MPETITIEEAQAHLSELIAGLVPGEEIVITRNNRPVAELRPLIAAPPMPHFGNCKGSLIISAEDDEHLTDFADYMP